MADWVCTLLRKTRFVDVSILGYASVAVHGCRGFIHNDAGVAMHIAVLYPWLRVSTFGPRYMIVVRYLPFKLLLSFAYTHNHFCLPVTVS